ncbi:MAG: Do family serine endopeptidase [Alphaproteobacteria bacterium]|nr:Do family serine endopeptidase [Alphaproteobacteria bacterium]
MKRLYMAIALAITIAAPALGQDAAPVAVPQSEQQVKLSYAPVVKQVAPAVVNIYTKRVVARGAMNPFADDPFFAPFFEGFTPMRKRVEQSLGSGFIIDTSGLIVTNAHVIKDAQEIVVAMNDGEEFEAKTVLVDTPSDLGLLRIDPKGKTLPTVRLGNSEGLEVGDIVIAVGNPFGVGQTVTSGIVSALARSNTDINDYDFFIQTDAAINPGNSGGPLVAMDGSVVGVNSAIFSKSGGSLGIGFAIPAEMVHAVIDAENSGHVSKTGVVRPWLGFTAQSVTADIAASMGLEHPRGALVSDVAEGGPAEEAGLKRGDLITSIGGRDVRDAEELRYRIATLPIGTHTSFGIKRDGSDVAIEFTASPPPEIPSRAPVTVKGQNILQGATIVNVSPAIIEELGFEGQEDGVVVYSVLDGSNADQVGLEAGDGIIAIGNRRVTDTSKLEGLLANYDARRGWVLTIRRGGRDQTLILR